MPRSSPVDDGRTSHFVSGSGRAPALPSGVPAGFRPAVAPPPERPRPDEAPHRRGPRRPVGPVSGRFAVAAVAAGALATAGHSLATGLDAPTTQTRADLSLSATSSATGLEAAADDARATPSALDAATTGVLAVAPTAAPATRTAAATDEVSSLTKARQIADSRAREAAEAEAAARAPQFATPADGRFTSGFGARWGTSHRGIDIANSIGTPLRAVADGTVIEAGPASGFGMWVRVRLEDGTINVYGHINRALVSEGDRVTAGQEIAEMGNRGKSTGPHLHFEVWTQGEKKINPLPWMAERGISPGSSPD